MRRNSFVFGVALVSALTVLPSAFAQTVSQISGLTDFHPKPRYVRAQPQFTCGSGCLNGDAGQHFISPGDDAVIYDINPLYTAGITGTGQTIGIAGQTDIVMADITSFRSAAGLPANNPTVFLIPGSGSTLRVNGHAHLSVDPNLLASFRMGGKPPRSVIVITVNEIYLQCARAIVRSDLWNPQKHVNPASLPTPGQILAEMSENRVGGEDYDRAWPERARLSLW